MGHRLTQSVPTKVLLSEASHFLIVGVAAGIVTIGLFNVLVHVGNSAPLAQNPIVAYWVAFAVGVAVAYLGNLKWTYKGRQPAASLASVALFIVINLVSLAFPSICLVISRYILGFSGPVADNVSANVVGLALAMLFRFAAYRTWVFRQGLTSPRNGPTQGELVLGGGQAAGSRVTR